VGHTLQNTYEYHAKHRRLIVRARWHLAKPTLCPLDNIEHAVYDKYISAHDVDVNTKADNQQCALAALS
jgi:hypothetical protein